MNTRAYAAARRAKKRADGICWACKKPIFKASLCEGHYEAHKKRLRRNYNRKKQARASVAAWRAKQKEKGLCRACKEPIHKAGLCADHYIDHTAKSQSRGIRSCGACGERGHVASNARCPKFVTKEKK